MAGSFAGRGRHHSRKADVAVRIELGDVDVPVGQRLEPYRAEERPLRLDQQDRLREARIVEATAEVYARLDRKYLELIDGEPQPVRSSGSMTWVRYSLMSTTLPRPKATLTQCLPATCATPAIVPLIRTRCPADSSARPPTSMSNGSPVFRPLATTASTAVPSVMVAISTSAKSCAITCCSTHVAEPERSEWSASTTGHAPRATASLASFTPWGMGCTVAVFSSASRRRHAKVATSSAALRASSGLPLVIAWTVMPTSGTSAKSG